MSANNIFSRSVRNGREIVRIKYFMDITHCFSISLDVHVGLPPNSIAELSTTLYLHEIYKTWQ